eukprot:TRINITY_DN1075_c0_g1_i1.p1 TRINITY_DN1075_c0_g1~~TRINITY_DN1075_c0_g1_i1.p1  ORF type:complete len:1432 (+),score=336.45 TRINITY_DN1075_c0_g1_i1:54-4298(+)
MLEPTIVHDYKKPASLHDAPKHPPVLSFRVLIFEAGADGGPAMDMLRDIKIKYGSEKCKMILFKKDIAPAEKLICDVMYDEVIEEDCKKETVNKILSTWGTKPKQVVAFVTTINGSLACHASDVGLIVASAPNALKVEDDFRAAGSDAFSWDKSMTISQLQWLYTLRVEDTCWQVHYFHYNPAREILRETLTSIGNGYMGVRGSCDWVRSDGSCSWHYPATYLAGTYNSNPSIVHGKEILNSDLVNFPNWTLMQFKIGADTEWTNPLQHKVIEYSHGFDLAIAQMERFITFEDAKGRRTRISSVRLASMASHHLAAQTFCVTPLNYSLPILVKSSIDGDVYNHGVKRYMALNQEHIKVVDKQSTPDGMYLVASTTGRHERIDVAMYARHHVFVNGALHSGSLAENVEEDPKVVSTSWSFDGKQGTQYLIEKIVSIYTSKDGDISGSALESARSSIGDLPFFKQIAVPHRIRWRQIWDKIDIQLKGNREAYLCQRMARMHLYHLIASFSDNNKFIDAGFTARGLTGESYRGHVFWDEVYLFPIYNATFPEASKAHLLYRTRRLQAAKDYAAEHGYKGAMIPWQTSDKGIEETQVIHYNPLSGNWDPDMSCRQRHVGIAVFYNGWKYFEATDDKEFLSNDLGVLMLEIARFWASIAKLEADGFVHISGVMGPDEYHEHVLCEEGGVVDNAYTNVMVVWLLRIALTVLQSSEYLPREAREALLKKANITPDELQWWKIITQKMKVWVVNGILQQFKGYDDLEELDWDHYRKKWGDIRRLDRILKKEGKTPDKYKLAKQADTLMLYYLLRPEEVTELLRSLGVEVKDTLEFLRANYDYYQQRTSHGSTLSYTVHAKIAFLIGYKDVQWKWFMEAANSDVFDRQYTTHEGIHCGVMAGTVDMLLSNFIGLRETSPSKFSIQPNLPPRWDIVRFNRLLRGKWYHFKITKDSVTISHQGEAVFSSTHKPATFEVAGNNVSVAPWRPVTIHYALTSLKDFYNLMCRTQVIRSDIVQRIFDNEPINVSLIDALRYARNRLATVPVSEGKYVLDIDADAQELMLDLNYEVNELNRDLLYLTEGEDAIFERMERQYRDWKAIMEDGLEFFNFLKSEKLSTWLTDRDGTTNLYCGRYMSSIQSVYNSVWVSSFAKHCSRQSAFITSAPLGGGAQNIESSLVAAENAGIISVSVNPPGLFIYGASKGRECLDVDQRVRRFAMTQSDAALITAVTKELSLMLKKPRWQKFAFIGSAMQVKFGEVVIARQDVSHSISSPESASLIEEVRSVVNRVDPSGENLTIHDTGLDLEITLAKSGKTAFSKGDGVKYLNKELSMGITPTSGTILVSGDTSSDLPMLEAAIATGDPSNVFAMFVTENKSLADRVRALCPRSLIVPTADHLVGILRNVAKQIGGAPESCRVGGQAKL